MMGINDINNLNQEAFIYKNNSESINDHHFISVKLKGKIKNSFAIGSKIFVYADSNIFNAYLMPSRGFQSSVDYKIVLGLGETANIDSLIVIAASSLLLLSSASCAAIAAA